MRFGKYRGKLLSYDAKTRTAMVHVIGLTDGLTGGIEATLMYGLGEDDRDTELQLELDVMRDVFVEFENGDENCPIIVGYASHSKGAVVDVRRIRQKNIELFAKANIQIEADTLNIKGSGTINVTSETLVNINAPTVAVNGY